jgi:hypothetical protein
VDTLQVTPARYNEFMGLAHVPWDIKAVFGMVSDMWPIAGYRLSPYIISAGVAGIVAYSFLAFGGLAATTAAFMCLLINFAHASPDVMIDGSVAIRMKTHPALASDLQTLCWGSTGLCGIVAALVQGPVVDAYAKPVFLSHFYVHAIFSPRQARDKHRESTQKRQPFSQVGSPPSLRLGDRALRHRDRTRRARMDEGGTASSWRTQPKVQRLRG